MKTYIIHSGYTNDEIVGKIHCDDNNNLTCEVLIPDDRFDFPIDLLGPHRDWEKDHTPTIQRWLESRVISRNKQFLKQLLAMNNLSEWDLDTLLKLNQGKTTNDKFSIEIIEDPNESI